jgi:hypothetical protein
VDKTQRPRGGCNPPTRENDIKAIIDLPAELVRGRKKDQKGEEKITRKYKNTEKIWDKKKKRWVQEIQE